MGAPPQQTQYAHPQQQQAYGNAYGGPPVNGYQGFGGPQQQNGIPDLRAFGVNDATAQMGMTLGKNAMAVGQDYVQKNFGAYFLPTELLKHQFNVSNSYVLNKLRIVLFPWRHRPWSRKVRRSETNGQSEGYQAPREDINSPDLYIPTMALVTYVLMTAFLAGLKNNFHGEVLGIAASKAFVVLLLELSFVKLGCYFLNIQSPVQIAELLGYGGYKFVGVILTMIASVLLGRKMYWCVFLYSFGATGFFLLRSLRWVVLPDVNSNVGNSTVTHSQRGWRVRFLIAMAIMQILYMAILVI